MLNLKTYSIELTGYLSSEYFLDSAKETKFSWECWVGNKIYSRLDWWLQHSTEFKAILCLITSLLDLANSHSLCFKSSLADALNSHFLQLRLSAILRCFVLFFSKLGFQSLRFCTNQTSALIFCFYSLDLSEERYFCVYSASMSFTRSMHDPDSSSTMFSIVAMFIL